MFVGKYFVVKIGGSILTNKNNPKDLTIKRDILESNLKILGEYCKKNQIGVLICNGAGNYGHTKAKYFLDNLQNLSKTEIYEYLNEIHIDVVNQNLVVQEIAYKFIEKEYILGFEFGDVNFNGPNYIISTENKIYKYLKKSDSNPEFIIFMSDQNGIYKDFSNQSLGILDTIKLSDKNNPALFKKSKDATGGMKQKYEMAKKLLKFTENIYIINGFDSNNLNNLLAGIKFIGTTFKR